MDNRKIIEEIADLIIEKDSFLVVSHVDPDGDAIGSMLALSEGLMDLGKEVWPFTHKPLRRPFSCLPDSGILREDLPDRLKDYVCIALDCASENRLGILKDKLRFFSKVINIDHHSGNTFFGDINFAVGDASCAGELVFSILKTLNIPLGKGICENIYYAIQTDTGGFRFENTSQGAFDVARELIEMGMVPWDLFKRASNVVRVQRLRLLSRAIEAMEFFLGGKVVLVGLKAELFHEAGAELEDAEEMAETFRSIDGVEVAIVARELENGHFKFSMRSNGALGLTELAKRFDGGGHRLAAGFEAFGKYDEVRSALVRELEQVWG